jgi:hypothetical protein
MHGNYPMGGGFDMKKSIAAGITLFVFAICTTSIQAEPAPSVPCDRACLTAFVDAYINVLSARNPSLAEFSSDARFTENDRNLLFAEKYMLILQ